MHFTHRLIHSEPQLHAIPAAHTGESAAPITKTKERNSGSTFIRVLRLFRKCLHTPLPSPTLIHVVCIQRGVWGDNDDIFIVKSLRLSQSRDHRHILRRKTGLLCREMQHIHLLGGYLLDLFLRWKQAKERSNFSRKKKRGKKNNEKNLLCQDLISRGNGVCVCLWLCVFVSVCSCESVRCPWVTVWQLFFFIFYFEVIYLFPWQIVDMQKHLCSLCSGTQWNSSSPLCNSLFEQCRNTNKKFPSYAHMHTNS